MDSPQGSIKSYLNNEMTTNVKIKQGSYHIEIHWHNYFFLSSQFTSKGVCGQERGEASITLTMSVCAKVYTSVNIRAVDRPDWW